MKKNLVNLVSFDKENIPFNWLLKLKKMQHLGNEFFLNFASFTIKINLASIDVYKFCEVLPKFGKPKKDKLTKLRFMIHCLICNMKAILRLKNISGKYDVVYSPSSVLDLVIFPFFLKYFDRNIKWVTVFDNIVPFSDPGNRITRFLSWFFFRTSLILVRKADVIFVISEDLEDYLLKRGYNRKQLVLSSNGTENNLIKKAVANNKYDIGALYIGRINETKGIYDMLNVLEIVRERYPDFQLAIMGEGDKKTKKKFENKIKKMNLGENVQFLGYRAGQEKFDIIKSSKCFWFLSHSESFGIALLEAASSGIPAFAYDLPEYSRIYKNGEVDFSPKGDCELVAQKIIRLFKSGNFKNEAGEKLLGKYSWEKIAEIEYNAIKNL